MFIFKRFTIIVIYVLDYVIIIVCLTLSIAQLTLDDNNKKTYITGYSKFKLKYWLQEMTFYLIWEFLKRTGVDLF